jgi:hypothetical protein
MTTDDTATDLETDALPLDADADVASEPETPRAPGPDPVALGDLLARVQLAAARPEREEELRQRLALADRRRRTALRTTANLLGVPEDEDLRAVALDDRDVRLRLRILEGQRCFLANPEHAADG